jgi:serine protease Do
MHRFFVLICSLLVSLPAFATDYGTYQKVAASVIRVVANIPGVGTSFGSGVVLPGGRVVTNCHVMPDARRVAVIDGAARTEAIGNSGDFTADLCVLETGPLVAPAVRMGGTDSLQVGDEVVAIGFGGGGARSISAGKVTALYPYRGGQVIRSTAAFRQGASGGGLFDRHGNLVGITTFYRRGGSEYSFFAIPVDWIGSLPLAAPDVQPHASPFWSRAHAEQPHFLQVATLEADGKWVEMAEAARLWSAEEPAQAQPREALSRALSAQGQAPEGDSARQGAQEATAAAGGMRE